MVSICRLVFASIFGYAREGGHPEPASGLNRGQPARTGRTWTAAFAGATRTKKREAYVQFTPLRFSRYPFARNMERVVAEDDLNSPTLTQPFVGTRVVGGKYPLPQGMP